MLQKKKLNEQLKNKMKKININFTLLFISIAFSIHLQAQNVLSTQEAVSLVLENNYGIKIANNAMEVADNNTYSCIAPMAAIVLGDIAKAAGDTSSASEWYEKAQLDEAGYGNAFQSLANARLMLVNAEPPAKIKPALPSEDQDAKLTPLKLEAPDTAEAPATKPAAATPATAEAPAKTAPNPAPVAPAGKKAE